MRRAIQDLLCQAGAHNWTAARRYLRGISLYEEETCRSCGTHSTVVSGLVEVTRLNGHLSQ